MTIPIPNRLIGVKTEHSDLVVTFTQNLGWYRHVWIWDTVNGKLTYTQMKRGRWYVRVRNWGSNLLCESIQDATRSLRPFGEVQWFGKSSIDHIRHAFTA